MPQETQLEKQKIEMPRNSLMKIAEKQYKRKTETDNKTYKEIQDQLMKNIG